AGELGRRIDGPRQADRFWSARVEDEGLRLAIHAKAFGPDGWLDDGGTVRFGDVELEVIHCPGHTPGHVVFFHRQTRFAFVGDVLFAGSIGRTDFPMGNHQDLLDAITGKLWPLGDEVTFVPGHGPTSTFGRERQSNPYVGDAAIAAARWDRPCLAVIRGMPAAARPAGAAASAGTASPLVPRPQA